MPENAITVKDLRKVYAKRNQPPVTAVDGISFSVRQGEIFGLLGPNGAGKTTTLKILTTLLQPTSGEVSILGLDVQKNSLEVRRNMVVVLQENAVDLYLSVQDNLATFARFHAMPKKEALFHAGRVIELFGLAEYRRQKPMDLSGGLKRRLQVAKVFMVSKPIVYLDEATTGMDTFNKRTTIAAIKEEARRGRTIVLTTHILDEAEELCDSLVIINHGKIVAAGSPDTVKKLSLRIMYLTLSFDELTQAIIDHVQSFQPLQMSVRNHTLEIAVRDDQAALRILSSIGAIAPIRHFDVNGATLEDVFVNLLDKSGGNAR